jgi:hypothetical protein
MMQLKIEASISHRILKYILLCTLLWNFVSRAQTVYVPSSHWVYDFLDRMETKRLLPVVLAGAKPMTRKEIAAFLDKLIDQQPLLNKTERDQLDFLRFEFQEELPQERRISYQSRLKTITKNRFIDPWLPDFVYPQGRHLFEVQQGPLSFHLDPVISRSRMFASADTLTKQEKVFTDANGFTTWGTLAPLLGYVVDVRDTREWGTRAYPSGNTTALGVGFAQGNGRQIYHDEAVAYLTLQWRYINLQFGKDSNRWGPAHFGQLMLSDLATSYDMFKFQVSLPRVRFTSLLMWLRDYSPDYFSGSAKSRMATAHRIDFAPFAFLDLGLQETVIFADRDFEAGYLNPVMFYRSAEHYYGDSGNAAMGLDFELNSLPNTKLYGELFIDDLTTGKLGTNFYGNKYGYTAGLFHVDFLSIPELDLRLEYTRVRPFTYTHKNEVTRYQHFSTLLGHWIGPNSDLISSELSYRLSRRTLFLLGYERLRHGDNPPGRNVGSDPNLPHEALNDSENAVFLAGLLERSSRVRITASYELLRNLFLQIEGSWAKFDSEWPQFSEANPGVRRELVLGFSLNK